MSTLARTSFRPIPSDAATEADYDDAILCGGLVQRDPATGECALELQQQEWSYVREQVLEEIDGRSRAEEKSHE